jgi:2'-5' RNA ligase
MIRLFTAIALPEALRDRLVAIQGGVPGARWSPAENLHVTLVFIGNVADDAFADVAAALDRVRAAPFDLAIEGVGHFAAGRKPTTIWAGIAADGGLVRLHDRIAASLDHAGFPAETRKFTPHVTLARLNRSPRDRVASFIAGHALLRLPPFRAESFTLFSSGFGHDHPTYRPEAVFGLGA